MEKYIGIKQVEARPLTLGSYNEYRGWKIPDNEDPNREGYLVKYDTGYESWCPKEEFEKANISSVGLDMTAKFEHPYQQRVQEEVLELNEKLCKLADFIYNNSFFSTLDIEEQERLKLQELAMIAYFRILAKRIGNFK